MLYEGHWWAVSIIKFDYFQEEKKVLFYYPYDSSADERIKNVGLSEAIIKFSKYVNC